jgi:hypothetical protein
MKDDLRFREAKPIVGGREQWGAKGLEHGALPSDQNYFQGRYAIRHAWTGPIKCANPQRGVWGGPPDGGNNQLVIANKLAYVPRGKLSLPQMIKRDIPEIGVRKAATTPLPTTNPAPRINTIPTVTPGAAPPRVKVMSVGGGMLGGLALIGLGQLVARRRRKGQGA